MDQDIIIEIKYGDGLIVNISVIRERYKSIKAMLKAITGFIKALSGNTYLLNVYDYFNVEDIAIMSYVSTIGVKTVNIYYKKDYEELKEAYTPIFPETFNFFNKNEEVATEPKPINNKKKRGKSYESKNI